MAKSDMQQEAASGFGGYFTRFFSLFTLLIAYMIVSGEADLFGDPGQNQLMALWLGFLGLHGLLTRPANVGFIRKLLCYLSGVAGATVAFNVLGQLLG